MKRFKQNFLLAASLLASLSLSAQKKGGPSSSVKPNIIFIMADDHTSQSWGIYGGVLKDYVVNKNIKRLAAEGAVLNNAFCTNSICVPSRATIMTGQYSQKNNVYTLGDGLDPEHPSIAKVLQGNGYQTALIGKWHLKKKPSGFDHFMVMDDQGIYFDPTFKTEKDWKDDGEKAGTVYKGYNTDLVTDYSIDWLKHRDTSKPFFMMTHFKATHEPWEYPERYNDLYARVTIPEPVSILDFGPETNGRSFKGQDLEDLEQRWEQYQKNPQSYWTTYPGMPFTISGLDSIQARKKIYQKFVKDYLRCAAAIDDNIGRLLDYLKSNGLAENTIVIYTSDQGYFLGEHGFFDKRMMYEESSRMPFVICYPKEIKGGTRINDIVLNIDFAALFADYAGIKKPDFIQGESFRANLKGKTPKSWRKSMYYRYWEHSKDRPAHFGIRDQRYKLIFYYGQGLGMKDASNVSTTPAWEFYDLLKDPKELHNAINDPGYQQTIAGMKVELLKQKQLSGDDDSGRPVMKEIMDKYWLGNANPVKKEKSVRIDTTAVVKIGGIKQFIKLQGADQEKPLLLFLHGGPGTSLIPVADTFTDKLKTQFLVVQWDQRDVGETLKLNPSTEKLSLDLLQQDTYEVIKYLLHKYNRKKLFLVSHSFGSMLGFNIAEKHPELLYAYIPISAIVDQRKSEQLTMELLSNWAKETNNDTARKELALVKLPFENEDDLFYSQKWLFIHNGVDFAKEDGFKAKYHDWLAIWFPMWKQSVKNNLFKTLPVLNCPVYFIEGNGDQQKSHYLVEDYYKFLKAPKKALFWFEKSGHTVFNSEPEKLQQVIIEEILPAAFH